MKSMATLKTRLRGRPAVLFLCPTGVGPLVWVGDLAPESPSAGLGEVRVAPDLGELLLVLLRASEGVGRGMGR